MKITLLGLIIIDLEHKNNMLLPLHRAEISGDQAKIKEYTKGLNTLNKEIMYQEKHNPMLKEALQVQEYLFNGNSGEK